MRNLKFLKYTKIDWFCLILDASIKAFFLFFAFWFGVEVGIEYAIQLNIIKGA